MSSTMSCLWDRTNFLKNGGDLQFFIRKRRICKELRADNVNLVRSLVYYYIYKLRHGMTLYTEWCAVLTLRVSVAGMGMAAAPAVQTLTDSAVLAEN